METPKEQAIKAAYGELYKKYEDRINKNDGYLNYKSEKVLKEIRSIVGEVELHPHYVYIFRPKSLQGLENNNGWNKVEFDSNGNLLDKDSLPKKPGEYNIINRWGTPSKYILKSDQNEKNVRDWQWSKYTHWRSAEAYKPPIF
ncbi:hypothetical protein EH151_12685 [Elizabethkingia anophelis]|uniref:hypothetical protein n=1 Tax=Elizabethkingia anophelis TaxID=1117645 RepID=UPI00136CB007|nr:hypothetical protein [Elizabethkingia anophelis]MYZ60743.1 hypothetical protein [Elizabethkingia anophelis]